MEPKPPSTTPQTVRNRPAPRARGAEVEEKLLDKARFELLAKDSNYVSPRRERAAVMHDHDVAASSLLQEEEDRQRALLAERERWEFRTLLKWMALEFDTSVFKPSMQRLLQSERNSRLELHQASLNGFKELERTFLLMNQFVTEKRQRLMAKERKRLQRCEKLGREVSIDEVSSDEEMQVALTVFTTPEGPVVRSTVHRPAPPKPGVRAPPRRITYFQIDTVAVLAEEKRGREMLRMHADNELQEIRALKVKDLEAVAAAIERKLHLGRLAFWREQRDARIKAQEQFLSILSKLKDTEVEECDAREVAEAALWKEFEAAVDEIATLRWSARFSELLGLERRHRRETWRDFISSMLADIERREEIDRRTLDLQLESDHDFHEFFPQRQRELLVLHREWTIKREKIIVIQRAFRRSRWSGLGWKRSHRHIGDTIRQRRQLKLAQKEKAEAKDLLKKLRSSLQEAEVDLQAIAWKVQHATEIQESKERVKLEEESRWWLEQLIWEWKREATTSVMNPLLRRLEDVEETSERRQIRSEWEDDWVNRFDYFFHHLLAVLRRKLKLESSESVARQKVSDTEKEERQRMKTNLETGLKALQTEEESRQQSLRDACAACEFAEGKTRQTTEVIELKNRQNLILAFQAQALDDEQQVSLKEQNLLRRFYDCFLSEIDCLATSIMQAEFEIQVKQLASNVVIHISSVLEHQFTESVAAAAEDIDVQVKLQQEEFKTILSNLEQSWNAKRASCRKIWQFWSDIKAGKVGRKATQAHLKAAFAPKRERMQEELARAAQRKVVRSANSELQEAIVDYISETDRHFQYQRLMLEKRESRARESVAVEEGFHIEILMSNFYLWAQGLIRNSLHDIVEHENYWRHRIIEEYNRSFQEQFNKSTLKTFLLNASLQPLQRAWRRQSALRYIQNRIQEAIAHLPANEFHARSIIELLEESERYGMQHSQFALEFQKSHAEFLGQLTTSLAYDASLQHVVVDAERNGFRQLFFQQESRLRRVAVEDVEMVERRNLVERVFADADRQLQHALKELSDRGAIQREAISAQLYEHFPSFETLLRFHNDSLEQLHRLEVIETTQRHLVLLEGNLRDLTLFEAMEDVSRQHCAFGETELRKFLTVWCQEMKYRSKTSLDFLSELGTVCRVQLEEQYSDLQELEWRDSARCIERWVAEGQFLTGRQTIMAEHAAASEAMWSVNLVLLEEARRAETLSFFSLDRIGLEVGVRLLREKCFEVQHLLDECQSDIVGVLLQEERARRRQIELDRTHQWRSDLLPQYHQAFRMMLVDDESKERAQLDEEVNQCFDQLLSSEQHLHREVAAATIQRQWREKLKRDHDETERTTLILQAAETKENEFMLFIVEMRSLQYLEFRLPEAVIIPEELAWRKLLQLSEASLFGARLLDQERVIVLQEEAEVRLNLVTEGFFLPIVTPILKLVVPDRPPTPPIQISSYVKTEDRDGDGSDEATGTSETEEFTLEESAPAFDTPEKRVDAGHGRSTQRTPAKVKSSLTEHPFFIMHSPAFATAVKDLTIVALSALEGREEIVRTRYTEDRNRFLRGASSRHGTESKALAIEEEEKRGRRLLREDETLEFMVMTEILPSSEGARDDLEMEEDLARLSTEEREDSYFKDMLSELQREWVAERQRKLARQDQATLRLQSVSRRNQTCRLFPLRLERLAVMREATDALTNTYNVAGDSGEAHFPAVQRWLSARAVEDREWRVQVADSENTNRLQIVSEEEVTSSTFAGAMVESARIAHEKWLARQLTPDGAVTKISAWYRMLHQRRQFGLAKKILENQISIRVRREAEVKEE
jgi:hypothetical protein